MISVNEAAQIILSEKRDFGVETLPLLQCVGRVLAENLYADRDFPPYNRVAMDGITIDYQGFIKGLKQFKKIGIQAAGVEPLMIQQQDECIEIMTGAALPPTCDTVIRYEDLTLENDVFTLKIEQLKQGQNVHQKGKDKQKNDVLVADNQIISSSIIQIAASIGTTHLKVKKLPKIAVISSGDELLDIDELPNDFQIRRSNSYTLAAALLDFHIKADILHLSDNEDVITKNLSIFIEKYDVLILSGGVSMGKFDHIPNVLQALQVEQLFHKIAQRPGKPFWFGKSTTHETIVFALPGNPVSTFLCFHRYIKPWLAECLAISMPKHSAILSQNITFLPDLQYFIPVKISQNEQAQSWAMPLNNNGSGDFANLVEANAFMELPAEKQLFQAGEIYQIWYF